MRKWIPFNSNQCVRVKLTDHGRAVLKELSDIVRHDFPGLQSYWPYPDEDENGWSEWQLWVLMQTFGPHVGNGFDLVFETEIEISINTKHL